MVEGLHTTNIFLGIMAVISLLEGVVIVGLAVGGVIAYRRVMTLVDELEAKHVAPLAARVNAIIDDVKGVTSRVTEQTERVDHAIKTTITRVDVTADRVKSSVQSRAWQAVAIVRGIRTGLEAFLSNQPHEPHAHEPGRA